MNVLIKQCTSCKTQKEITEFYKDSHLKSGYASSCKKCISVRQKTFKENNKDYFKQYNKQYWIKNKKQMSLQSKKYYEENKENLAEQNKQRSKKHFQENKHLYNAKRAKYRASKLKATPKWADLKAIKIEYSLASWCSAVTGVPYEVDHIIPLQGENVCGLHVHYNLQVIQRAPNRSKGNKHA